MPSPAEASETTIAETHFGGDDGSVALTAVRAMVIRDPMMQYEVDFLLHELPIAQQIHGRENVREISRSTARVSNFNAFAEADRLRSLYNTKSDDYVTMVYGTDPGPKINDIQGLGLHVGEAPVVQKSIQNNRRDPDQVRRA
jgi:hypothetical protein